MTIDDLHAEIFDEWMDSLDKFCKLCPASYNDGFWDAIAQDFPIKFISWLQENEYVIDGFGIYDKDGELQDEKILQQKFYQDLW